MSVLLLRFAAPLQAWGAACRFNRRQTEREPGKSAVVGLLAAALGRRRDEAVDDLAALRFGVRIDQIGRSLWDFHTARKEDAEHPFVSTRQYLSDAVFLVGLEGDEGLLAELDQAVKCPAFPIFLGRRSCPPTGEVSLGVAAGALLEVLAAAPWQAAAWYRRRMPETVELEVVHDAAFDAPGAFVRRDMPVSFSQEYRRYSFRSLMANQRGVVLNNRDSRNGASRRGISESPTGHDPLSALEAADVSIEA